MSLVGSLEDLGLGDILQIVSLSGKSGVLELHADEGEGKIQFAQGRIRSALVQGGPTCLAELLESRSLPPVDAIAADELDAALHEHLEDCVLRMFTWSAGEFSFEVGDPATQEHAGLCVDPGLNPQFLALEGTRRADELAMGLDRPKAAVLAEPYAGGEPEPVSAPHCGLDAPPAPDEFRPLPPLVFVDPDLAVVEWARASLPDELATAHLFQMTEQGIARIRQYLRRAEIPVLILSTGALADPVSGARTAAEVVERLLRQAPQMRILMLEEVGQPISADLEARTHGRIEKPTQTQLATPAMAPARERLGRELARELLRVCGREAPSLAPAVEDLPEISL